MIRWWLWWFLAIQKIGADCPHGELWPIGSQPYVWAKIPTSSWNHHFSSLKNQKNYLKLIPIFLGSTVSAAFPDNILQKSYFSRLNISHFCTSKERLGSRWKVQALGWTARQFHQSWDAEIPWLQDISGIGFREQYVERHANFGGNLGDNIFFTVTLSFFLG